MYKYNCPILGLMAVLSSCVSAHAQQQQGAETPQAMLAAQVRLRGFACDKPLGATRDIKSSRPDHAVWVLKCTNAIYRVSRAPDMEAKVEPLR
jgi:hypothetical protein